MLGSVNDASEFATIDCVLVDDDALVHMMWKHSAKTKAMTIMTVFTEEEFWAKAGTLSKQTPIYIDVSLSSDGLGEALAYRLHVAGYQELYLQTGFKLPDTVLLKMPWLKGVVGKRPPWL